MVCPANEEGSLDNDIISLVARKDTTVLRLPQRFTPNYFSMGVCLASHVMPGKSSFFRGWRVQTGHSSFSCREGPSLATFFIKKERPRKRGKERDRQLGDHHKNIDKFNRPRGTCTESVRQRRNRVQFRFSSVHLRDYLMSSLPSSSWPNRTRRFRRFRRSFPLRAQ